MQDTFLEAAILNWNDVDPRPAPASDQAEPAASSQVLTFNPSVVLPVLYVLAILVVFYRWYIVRVNHR